MGDYKGISHDRLDDYGIEKKLMKGIKFPEIFSQKVDMSKVNLSVMKPWITRKVIEYLGFEDDVVIDFAIGMLEEESIDPKRLQINLTGFLEKNAAPFTKELWKLLLSAQQSIGGIPKKFLEDKKAELRSKKIENERKQEDKDNARILADEQREHLAVIRQREREERDTRQKDDSVYQHGDRRREHRRGDRGERRRDERAPPRGDPQDRYYPEERRRRRRSPSVDDFGREKRRDGYSKRSPDYYGRSPPRRRHKTPQRDRRDKSHTPDSRKRRRDYSTLDDRERTRVRRSPPSPHTRYIPHHDEYSRSQRDLVCKSRRSRSRSFSGSESGGPSSRSLSSRSRSPRDSEPRIVAGEAQVDEKNIEHETRDRDSLALETQLKEDILRKRVMGSVPQQ